MAVELFANLPQTTVSSGGTTAPAGGTVESWTVASSASFPAASNGATPPTQFHVADVAAGSEMILVTNVSGTTWTVTRGAENTTPVAHSAGFSIFQVTTAGWLNSALTTVNGYNVTIKVPAPAGATATDTPNVTTAITQLTTALASGPATLLFQDGTYQVDSNQLVFQSLSNFVVRGTGATVIQQAPNRSGAANNVGGNLFTFVSCNDFTVTGLTVDGLRDTVAPVTPLTSAAASGQANVTVGAGNGARYIAGQRLTLAGGLGSGEQNQLDVAGANGLTIQSITAGGGAGGGDLITFTTNLANTYNTVSGSLISDQFGPYGCTGAYVSPWQTGNATVAGRSLNQEDQQNGIHLIACKRFKITGNTIRNMWENPIRAGTHNLTGTSQTDGATDAIISGNTCYHGYDQGIGLWCSSNVTVTGNDINTGGWAGISLTGSSDCTVTGNVSWNNVQRIPGDNADGNGVAVEGGRRNLISGNRTGGNYGPGIRLTALGTLPFGSPGQVATTIAAGSNAAALPQGTVNVASTTGFAASGQFTVLSSAGAQQVTYTAKTGTSFTGCTGGIGTLFTGERVTQYPLFLNNGAKLAIGSTSTVVSDGTKFQVNGFYTIVDGGRTETFTVTVITTNTLTLSEATAYWHPDQCQISQSIPEETVISGNTISGPGSLGGGDAGILLASAVRTSIIGNTIDRAGSRGIDGVSWLSGGMQPPVGTLVYGNTITTPDVINSGAFIQAVAFQQCSDLSISGNHLTGIPGTAGGAAALYLQACSESVVAGNLVTDAWALGILLDSFQDWSCKGVVVSGNTVLRCLGEGIKLFGGSALKVTGNVVAYSAANGGGAGFGGAINIRGVTYSSITDNVVYNNGRGIGLDTAAINSVNVATANNVLSGNIAYDDGDNYDVYSGSLTQQNFGIKELSSGQGPNFLSGNILQGNTTNLSLTSTGNAVLAFSSNSATLTQAAFDTGTAGYGLKVAEGSNAKQGTAVLNGTTAVVVSNTSVTANSRIFLTVNTPGGTVGSPYVSATAAGTSFSIKSTNAADTSTVAYLITEPG